MLTTSNIVKNGSQYSGVCPRCDHKSQFQTLNELSNSTTITAFLKCQCGKYFILEMGQLVMVAPYTAPLDVPQWIPEHLVDDYTEMKLTAKYLMFKSAIALGSIIVETIVTEKMPKQQKSIELGKKIEHLIAEGSIDPDQLSSSTISRLSRNKVLHPKTSILPFSPGEVNEILQEVEFFIEREYKFRSSRALPAPAKTT